MSEESSNELCVLPCDVEESFYEKILIKEFGRTHDGSHREAACWFQQGDADSGNADPQGAKRYGDRVIE